MLSAKKSSFENLVLNNKQEILSDEKAMREIEEKMEKRLEKQQNSIKEG